MYSKWIISELYQEYVRFAKHINELIMHLHVFQNNTLLEKKCFLLLSYIINIHFHL
jgi:hypothetical protein